MAKDIQCLVHCTYYYIHFHILNQIDVDNVLIQSRDAPLFDGWYTTYKKTTQQNSGKIFGRVSRVFLIHVPLLNTLY